MGIRLEWDNEEKTVLCHVYEGNWTVDDFYLAVDESRKLLLGVDHPVDLIIDMRTGGDPPSGVLSAYQYADRQVPDNQRLIVMVNPGAVMQAFNRIVGNIAPRASENRYLVDSMEEARELIARFQAQVDQ